MRRVALIAASDEYDSAPGFALRGANISADGFMCDRDGRLLTHDVLEHVNGPGRIGPVWDECEALGAFVFVRGQFGGDNDARTSRFTLAENLASDIARMFCQWRDSESCFEGPKAPRARLLDSWLESEIAEAARLAATEALAEWDHIGDVDDSAERVRADLERYCVFVIERMRIGFRKASRRYRGNADSAFALFQTIRDALRDYVKRSELFEGAEYVLEYGNGRARVYLRGESSY